MTLITLQPSPKVKVVFLVFTAIAIITEVRATDSCYTTSIMAGMRQSSVSANTPKLSTTIYLGAAAAAAAASGVWLWGVPGGDKVPCVCCVSTLRGHRLRRSVSALRMLIEVDCVCRESCTT